MTKILDVVKPGVIAGKDLNKVFAVARENKRKIKEYKASFFLR